jgi:hypothetical protein
MIVTSVDIAIGIPGSSPARIGVNIARVAPIIIGKYIRFASPMGLDILTISPKMAPYVHTGK